MKATTRDEAKHGAIIFRHIVQAFATVFDQLVCIGGRGGGGGGGDDNGCLRLVLLHVCIDIQVLYYHSRFVIFLP